MLGAKLGFFVAAFIVVVSVSAVWMLVRRPRR